MKNMSLDNIVNLLCKVPNESVAFDFDGTIVNCEIRQVEVLRSILRRKDININNFNFENWWSFKINGSNTNNALIKLQINKNIAAEISQEWVSIIENSEWLDLDTLRPEILYLFKELKKMNKTIYIITARKSEYNFYNQIRKLPINIYVEKSIVVNPSKSIEEKKEILLTLKPSFFIGDTENDYYSAIESGVNFIGMKNGQRSKQYLSNLGVVQFIDNY